MRQIEVAGIGYCGVLAIHPIGTQRRDQWSCVLDDVIQIFGAIDQQHRRDFSALRMVEVVPHIVEVHEPRQGNHRSNVGPLSECGIQCRSRARRKSSGGNPLRIDVPALGL